MSLSSRDKKLLWHPFTQEKTAELPIAITKASGSYLYDDQGQTYLDLISSWWTNLHGHAHPIIAQAIFEQAITLEHVMFAGFTHEPAVKLCEGLTQILPANLKRFFFSDNGSTSVETALKMAYQYWWNQKAPHKKIFLSFTGGYHGDTFGAMSVGAKSGFHDPFMSFFFEVVAIPFPDTWEEDVTINQREEEAINTLERYLQQHSDSVAAIIIEPLVQGASGMKMCRASFIAQLMRLLKAYNILIIFDEVMTGFYRTGSYFALDQIGVTPDLLCLSKGLTGGFLPLALTITTEAIYEAFLGEHYSRALSHGHTYTANPLGCAAACASLDLLREEKTHHAITQIEKTHRQGMHYLQEKLPNIEKIRILGTIAAFDIQGQQAHHVNAKLTTAFLKAGLLIRPLGQTIYLLPPYCTSPNALEASYEKIHLVLEALNSYHLIS